MDNLVSVIMPAHNAAKTIVDSIESVISQTYKDWELLVIDDCSSDNTVSIVSAYVKKDNRIKLLQTDKSLGKPFYPRNVGIEAATGRYIAFLDSDDIWLPTKLEHQITLFYTKNVAIVFSYYSKMGENGELWNSVIKSPAVVNYNRLLHGDCIGNLTGIYDTQKCGKVLQEEIRHEDYLMWLEILKKGFVALNTNTCEAFYRIQKKSDSSNKFKAIQWQWIILRNELKLPFIFAIKCFCTYAISGLLKVL